MELKIGRNLYQITEDDIFIDNGACVQLLSQSKEKSRWGRRPNPRLSKRAIKEISYFDRVDRKHNYSTDVSVFSLDLTRK
jgi:hypothetical protein